MFKPKASETEQDLLELQKKFLGSGERPSASLSLAGSKRKTAQQPHGTADSAIPKDIVTLKDGEPRAKKSKFRERRERLRQKHESELHADIHKAMEDQDIHISKILTDIKDRGLLPTTSPHTFSTSRATKDGFPLVPVLDPDLLQPPSTSSRADPASPLAPAPHIAKPGRKPKSLFARMFEAKGPGFFGVEGAKGVRGVAVRDYVEPVAIGGDVEGMSCDVGAEPGASVRVCEEGSVEEVVREGYESTAAATWDNLTTTLISGAGLSSLGEPEAAVRSDVSKIHQENVERLSALSQAELTQERGEIERVLGPELVAFVKKYTERKQQKSEAPDSACNTPSAPRPPSSPLPDTHLPSPGSGHKDMPLTPPDGWVHMDVVEKEKLEWMMDVAPPSTNAQLDQAECRFSLEGLVIPRGVDIPSHLGLHHHGDEPQAAGYTLAELIPLCRSSVLQQRVLSLRTLSRIIRRARQREYEGVVVQGVMEQLLEAEVPLLLRYAVCEDKEGVVLVAVQAIHSLMVTSVDQELLAEYGLCFRGHRLPALKGRGKPVQKGEEEEETESDIFQRDIVEGFLKLNLLPRVRYLLEVFLVEAPARDVQLLLEILTQVARHSTGAASQILNCPRLMRVIFDQYLPLTWRGGGEEEDYFGCPQVAAVQLVQAMCIAGRHIAAQLVSKYNLLSVLTCYTLLHPSELNLPTQEAYPLAVASLGTWQVLIRYGLGDEAFRDTLPVFLKQLHQLAVVTELSGWESKRIAALLGLAESAICLAAVTPDQLRLVEGRTELAAPCVEWVHVVGLCAPLMRALVTWTRAHAAHTPDHNSLVVIGALLNTVATYYEKLRHKVMSVSPVQVLEEVEALVADIMKVLPTSPFFSTVLEVLREGSHLDSSRSPDASPVPLPSHFTPSTPPRGAVYGQPTSNGPDFQPHAVFMRCLNLLVGVARLCLACVQLHKGVMGNVSWMFTDTAYRESLRRAIVREVSSPVAYLRTELAHCTIKLFLMWAEAQVGHTVEDHILQFFHQLSFDLFISLPHGAEHVACDLLSNILFHPIFYRDLGPVTARDVYLKKLGLQKRNGCSPLECGSLLCKARGALMPSDWMFAPIMSEYNKMLQADKAQAGVDLISVKNVLSYLLLLEQSYPHLLAHLSFAAKLSRMMCFFLLGDLFLEDCIRPVLTDITKCYCKSENLSLLDLTRPIPGVQSFAELYTSFIEHYSATSYGDHPFSCFLLIPLMQEQPVFLRRKVWEEHPQVLRTLSIPLDQLPLDISLLLHPAEKDVGLVERYRFCLATELVREKWSPVLHQVAVHHVRAFKQ